MSNANRAIAESKNVGFDIVPAVDIKEIVFDVFDTKGNLNDYFGHEYKLFSNLTLDGAKTLVQRLVEAIEEIEGPQHPF